MIPVYVFDTGALISAERGKDRASRFYRLVDGGSARIVIPLPVVAEWWRGRTSTREDLLAAASIVDTVGIMKAAGMALARMKGVDSRLTIDAIVMATGAVLDATVVTGDVHDFEQLSRHFPGVAIISA